VCNTLCIFLTGSAYAPYAPCMSTPLTKAAKYGALWHLSKSVRSVGLKVRAGFHTYATQRNELEHGSNSCVALRYVALRICGNRPLSSRYNFANQHISLPAPTALLETLDCI